MSSSTRLRRNQQVALPQMPYSNIACLGKIDYTNDPHEHRLVQGVPTIYFRCAMIKFTYDDVAQRNPSHAGFLSAAVNSAKGVDRRQLMASRRVDLPSVRIRTSHFQSKRPRRSTLKSGKHTFEGDVLIKGNIDVTQDLRISGVRRWATGHVEASIAPLARSIPRLPLLIRA